MVDFTSTHTGAETDGATTDLIALVSASGLNKDIRVANTKKLQGLSSGAALIDLAYVNGSDEIVYGEAGSDIVMISSGVLVSSTGTATGTPATAGDDLVIDGTGSRGLSVIAGATGFASIYFGDPDDSNEAHIQHDNNTDEFDIILGAINALTIDSSQNASTPNGDFTASGGFSGYGSDESLTIATGVVTATKTPIAVDTEAAAAADDLDTINGGKTGDIIIVHGVNAARVVTLKHGTGNLTLNGSVDIDLTVASTRIMFMKFGADWVQTPGV